MGLTENDLSKFSNTHINHICDRHLQGTHCAHFVGHVLKIKSGALCNGTNGGFSIRANEIFNSLGSRGPWHDRPHHVGNGTLLIFFTHTGNVHNHRLMGDGHKHMGICVGNLSHDKTVRVYHCNSEGVVIPVSAHVFHEKTEQHYKHRHPNKNWALYYGIAP